MLWQITTIVVSVTFEFKTFHDQPNDWTYEQSHEWPYEQPHDLPKLWCQGSFHSCDVLYISLYLIYLYSPVLSRHGLHKLCSDREGLLRHWVEGEDWSNSRYDESSLTMVIVMVMVMMMVAICLVLCPQILSKFFRRHPRQPWCWRVPTCKSTFPISGITNYHDLCVL